MASGVDDDVGWLQVPVDDAAAVEFFKRKGDLRSIQLHDPFGERPVAEESLLQVAARAVFEDQIELVFSLKRVEKLNYERALHGGEDVPLSLDVPSQVRRKYAFLIQHFHREKIRVCFLAHQEHLPERPLADLAEHHEVRRTWLQLTLVRKERLHFVSAVESLLGPALRT